MDYVNLGKSGLKVSRLCLGMMTYGSSKWRKWVLDEEQALPGVLAAPPLSLELAKVWPTVIAEAVGQVLTLGVSLARLTVRV